MGIALVGCGTVGTGVAKLLVERAELLAQRAGRPLIVKYVIVRDLNKPRTVNLPHGLVATDFDAIVRDPTVDVVVELIGGTTRAKEIALESLAAGKHVVTANKALLAHHGDEIFAKARDVQRTVAFEASVAGGVPIIGALTQGLAANRITSLQGILNGTCNFILSAMSERGIDYAAALADAQSLGYAEADPTLDVTGKDTTHKLAILCRLAFAAAFNPDAIECAGIDTVSSLDIRLAGELGFVIKLLADAHRGDDGLTLRIGPTLVRRGTAMADVRGADNAVRVVGDAVGPVLLTGAGAGMMPTASAVVADLIDIAIGRAQATFEALRLWESKTTARLVDYDESIGQFYLRFIVADRPGVLAEIATLLAMESISIASVIQHATEHPEYDSVALVIVTHPTSNGRLRAALKRIETTESMREAGVSFPIADG